MIRAGDVNRNGQEAFVRSMQPAGTHPNAGNAWILRCRECKRLYQSNPCDFHERRCPSCQGGAP